jgi:hypothetical protein
MKKTLTLLLFLVFTSVVFAQYQERYLISSAGYYGQASGYYVSFSLGELVTGSFSAGGYTALVGFQQPLPGSAQGITEFTSLYRLEVFPNPATEVAYIRLVDGVPEAISGYYLVDMHGTLVHRQETIPNQFPFEISMRHLLPGMYFLRVHFTNGRSQTEKLILVK